MGVGVGAAGFSHVWLVFAFHTNTNVQRAVEGGQGRVRAKVVPPRVGEAVGVFASRSPHRPGAIGLSLVRLHHVDGQGPCGSLGR